MAKPRIEPVVWQPPKAPPRARQKASGSFALDVFDVPGAGPEDVVLAEDGHVFAGLSDGRILRVSPDGRHVDTVADTGGRPLGIEIDADGELLVCDARLGVLRVDPRGRHVSTLVDRIDGTPMVFCNNGAIAPGGNTSFGFQAGYSGSNATPTLTCTAS